jgi:hypothetical protein
MTTITQEQYDVERVIAAMRAVQMHVGGHEVCVAKDAQLTDDEVAELARAAMAATREIDAEALRNVAEEWPYLSAQENKRRETMLSIAADWLQQRALGAP